jgi:hypothetical protein
MGGSINKAYLAILAVLLAMPIFGQTQHNVTLTWTASTTTGVNYNIYRSLTAGGPYTKINATPITGLQYVDTTGVGGTKYFYVETAVCTAACPAGISGESAFSGEASATFLGSPAPGAGLQAVSN